MQPLNTLGRGQTVPMDEPLDDASVSIDPYLWLEQVDGQAATAWVLERNAETLATIAVGERFDALRSEIGEALDSTLRLPYPSMRGEFLYNFWQDAFNPRGLWRRTTLAEYRKVEPAWDVLLDIDALAVADGENWVWQGAEVLKPDYRRALLNLSRGGADAKVVREFDLLTKEFVINGFVLPEAKSDVSWIDENTIYVGTDFGAGSLTSSGYPRIVKRWHRGTPLSEAVTVYEGAHDDMVVYAYRDSTPGFTRDVVGKRMGFYTGEQFVLAESGELTRIDVPEDADFDIHRQWLLIRPRTAWKIGDVEYPAGSLLAADFDRYLAGERQLDVLFSPRPQTSLQAYSWTRNHLILTLLDDVRSALRVLTPTEAGWQQEPLDVGDGLVQVDVWGTNADHSDEYLLTIGGFTQPQTLRYGVIGAGVIGGGSGDDDGGGETLKQAPAFFDTTGMTVRQYFVASADGTQIPYFVVGKDAPAPTILSGYGGFEISRTPVYSPSIGRGWLARGGTYAVANIRGGGEYGPSWHLAALREKRLRAYEDFAAVAEDLVARGITTTKQLAAEGGSNGGLLTGVMLTRYPQLFGAIISHVPLLDMRRYHVLLAGASWVAEYGDPDNEQDWAFIQQYSPYQNMRAAGSYPPVLFATSTRDDRVHPGHARKMTARMREFGHDVAYYENVEGGHGAAADNTQLAMKWALVFSFLWHTLVDLPADS